MKVSLVYPGITGKGFDSLGEGMDSGWISHGLAMLFSAAKAKGIDIDLIDLRALRGWEHFREELARRSPDIVGITMMSVDYNPTMQCLALIKEIDPRIVTVVGGPHPTILPNELADVPTIDHIFIGEGEISFPEFVAKLERGESVPRIILGTAPDLDELPFGDRDVFLDEWRRWGYEPNSPEAPFAEELPAPFVTIIAGRGCKYNCSYCQPAERRIFGRGVRRRSVHNVMTELEMLKAKYKFNSFMFHDDCLTEDRDWVIAFCTAYRDAGFSQPFFCQSRADIIAKNEDMVRLMANAGLKGYFIGFESGSDRVLRFIRKGTTRAQNLQAARICRKYGIAIWANYMMGLPTETKEEVLETISMLKEIDPDYYSPAFYTPHPGSDLYEYCIENDLSLIKSHDGYRRNPTEPKINGVDYEFLRSALAESQRRTPWNAVRRVTRVAWKRYASPKKAVRRLAHLISGSDNRSAPPKS